MDWLSCQAQQVVISHTKSIWKPVTSDVPQGLTLGTLQLKLFINLDSVCSLSMFADDRKMGGAVGTPDGCAAIQRDLKTYVKGADPMKFNKVKYQVLHISSNNSMHQHRLQRKTMGLWRTTSCPWASNVPWHQRCLTLSLWKTYGSREMILSAQLTPVRQLECWVQL